MELSARQFGRIEAACAALAKLTEKNEVGTVLVNTIREQLDEAAETAFPGELIIPSLMDDLEDSDVSSGGGTSERTEEIRNYGQEILRQGAGLIPAIRMICEHFGLTQKEFAEMIGTSETTLSMAMTGKGERTTLLCRAAEFFGEDGKKEEI